MCDFLGSFEEPFEAICGRNDQRCQDRGRVDRREFQGSMQYLTLEPQLSKGFFYRSAISAVV